ncbi:PEFG-CTERM sorting domain-containing protein [Nitrosopumilus sp. K4]|nr:PEFG-CTERM sorting domain-containing protein [Nitrosopumilus sp. K4]
MAFFILFSVGLGVDAFATTYEIKIPSGASDPNAPYFWSEKTTGVTTGEITIHPGDSVTWENADTAFHTITSVTREGEPNDLFDSGFFTAGEFYTKQFPELGDFYYFCSLHPWMNGVVHVVKDPGSVKSIKGVASGFSQTGVGFEVKYILDSTLQQTVDVEPDERTLTFLITGETQNEQITLILPTELIENPNTVWIDGMQTDFDTEVTKTGTKLIIPIEPGAKEIKIMGSHVIPEFGILTMIILGIGVLSAVMVSRSKFPRF